MPVPKKLDPSSSPRALLGAELRHRREAAGLSQDELGTPLFVSGSFVGRLESGTRRMQLDQAQKFDEVLGADGFFARTCVSSSDDVLSTATWHKSSYSGASSGDCLEVADGLPDVVPVRDSKVTDGPALLFRTAAWAAFVTDLKRT